MNNLYIILIIAIIILLFVKSKENFGWGTKKECQWIGIKGVGGHDFCVDVPKVPSMDNIFNEVKNKITDEVLNPALNVVNVAKDAANAEATNVKKKATEFIRMMKELKFTIS